MSIRQAEKSELRIVKNITRTTINEIYPHYYPVGAVAFFLEHHSDENISKDIADGCVFLCTDAEQNIVGTVTIRKNEICRLFVLPQYQGFGYGKELICFAEDTIAEGYDEITLDASLSAKSIYLKRGYRETEYNTIETGNGDFLCFDILKKTTSHSGKAE
ncbi:MAG: GNAT family N-acetyltransferase [Ruminiclostridium sp.]|nr:GNAT family N-acetyltransferase [Ruminiclostridium sp.]